MTDGAVAMPEIEVFSRPGCHLCEQLIEELLPLIRGKFALVVRNIDSSDDWTRRYGLLIPVVCVDGREICHYTLDKAAILALGGTKRTF